MITIGVFDPLAQGEAQIDNLTAAVSDYSHEISAFGGYWSARIRLDGRQVDLEDWYERGLDRRIVAYSPDGVVVWEGFVNSVRLTLGGLQKTIGPVLDIANRVRLVYSFITAGGQDIGLRLTTDWADDADSQARYGNIEKVLSTGGATATTADQLRDRYLLERARPGRSDDFTIGGGGTGVELECAGYARRLETYTYSNATVGVQTIEAKIAAILDQDPNNILGSSNALLEASGLNVLSLDDDNRLAMNVIKELVQLGNSSADRMLFGVYANQQTRYTTVVQQTDYTQALGDTGQRIYTELGALIEPWYVTAGKWLRITDLLVGRVQDTTDLRDDPRFLFIETATFTAPDGVALRGGKDSRLDQRLARLGLSGIGG
jgi:hypothetical protein